MELEDNEDVEVVPGFSRKGVVSLFFGPKCKLAGVEGQYRVCNICRSHIKAVNSSNFKRHMERKHMSNAEFMAFLDSPADTLSSGSRLSWSGSNARLTTPFSQTQFEEVLMTCIIAKDLPLSIVESEEFRKLLLFVSRGPTHEIPVMISSQTLRRRLALRFQASRARLRLVLQQQQSVSFTSDMWTSDANVPFMAVTVHFIDDTFKPWAVVLDFVELLGSHTGTRMCDTFLKMVGPKVDDSDDCGFDLIDKIGGVCLDNAYNNKCFVNDLENRTEWKLTFHIRCFAHILNLCATVALENVKLSISNILALGVGSESQSPKNGKNVGILRVRAHRGAKASV